MNELFRKNLRFLSTQAAQGKGQVAAGEAAGVSQSAVSKIATGATDRPSFQTMVGLARHYGVSLDDLANRDMEVVGPSAMSQTARLDPAKLAGLIEAVDVAATRSGKRVSAKKRAEAVIAVYMDEQAWAAGKDAVTALFASAFSSMEET